jgi:hypothetical protein
MCNRRISKLVLLLLIALSIPGTIWGGSEGFTGGDRLEGGCDPV